MDDSSKMDEEEKRWSKSYKDLCLELGGLNWRINDSTWHWLN